MLLARPDPHHASVEIDAERWGASGLCLAHHGRGAAVVEAHPLEPQITAVISLTVVVAGGVLLRSEAALAQQLVHTARTTGRP